MADNRGGRQDADFRVRPPDATGERSDLMRGLPYGQRRDVLAATQAVPIPKGQSPGGGGGAAGGRTQRGLPKMLGKHGSLRPEQPISAGRDRFSGQGVPVSRQVLTQALETIIRSSDVVPVGLVQLRDMVADVP